jgi:hypothetical protein
LLHHQLQLHVHIYSHIGISYVTKLGVQLAHRFVAGCDETIVFDTVPQLPFVIATQLFQLIPYQLSQLIGVGVGFSTGFINTPSLHSILVNVY